MSPEQLVAAGGIAVLVVIALFYNYFSYLASYLLTRFGDRHFRE